MAKKTVQTVQTDENGGLRCPLCGSEMKPMSSGKGFRCVKGSVRKVGGDWVTTGCKGVVWNNAQGKVLQSRKVERPDFWPIIAKPTPEQTQYRADLAVAPAKRGSRMIANNAGWGTGKTTSTAWALEAVYNRLGDLSNWHVGCFNVNASLGFQAKTPTLVPNIGTLNSIWGRAQGYGYSSYDKGKCRKLFSDLVRDIPEKERPRYGVIGTLIERSRDLLLFQDTVDPSYWAEVVSLVCQRFGSSLAKKVEQQKETIAAYLPIVATAAFRFGGKIDLNEQYTRPVLSAMIRAGWTMRPECTSRQHEWTDADLDHLCVLVRAVNLLQCSLVVDEAQDLSLAQIVCALAQTWRAGELVIIGDDKRGLPGEEDYKAGQSIYGWRGAFGGSMKLICRLWKRLTGESAIERELTVTHRCAPEIVEALKPLAPQMKSSRPAGKGQAFSVSMAQAFTAWMRLGEKQTGLWVTRTNAALVPVFLSTIKAYGKVCLRGGGELQGQIDSVLYQCAGWCDEVNGEYKVSFPQALERLRQIVAELEKDSGGQQDPNSMERFVLEIMVALSKDKALLQRAELPATLTVGACRRFILYFADKDACRTLSTVYRCKGDEASLVVVDDVAMFNMAWNEDADEAAACRNVAASRAMDRLYVVGRLAGVNTIAPTVDLPDDQGEALEDEDDE